MVDRSLGIFSNQNNDSDILMNEILKKDYVYIRDKPAIDHLVKINWYCLCQYILINFFNW